VFREPGISNQADNSELAAALERLHWDDPPREVDHSGGSAAGPERAAGPQLRVLLVEDEFVCRVLLQTFLFRYGECHIAVNGREAVEAFRCASEQGQPYDSICMDIRMPEMDGREAVRQVRAREQAKGILSTSYSAGCSPFN
jgi:PleD family two-component response regulator